MTDPTKEAFARGQLDAKMRLHWLSEAMSEAGFRSHSVDLGALWCMLNACHGSKLPETEVGCVEWGHRALEMLRLEPPEASP